MASSILYPPIVDSQIPSFIAGTDSCRVYFTLSKFNNNEDFTNVQVTVIKQNNGISVVNTTDGSHKRATGIILDLIPQSDDGNVYYIDIENEDIKSGWTQGWIYKIQIRLSNASYGSSTTSQSAWLNSNANYFSEWSTVTIVKPIGNVTISLNTITSNNLNAYGTFSCTDNTEKLYSYRIITSLKNNETNIIEDSGEIIATDNGSIQYIKYALRKEYEYNIDYKLKILYTTSNLYSKEVSFNFNLKPLSTPSINAVPLVYEDNKAYMKNITSSAEEEEIGCAIVKLYSEEDSSHEGKVVLKRTDSLSNFKDWIDIKIININGKINSLPIIVDYTIESGVYYQYAIQTIANDSTRSSLIKSNSKIMRNFEYSFLLGENNKQLRLTFNNEINSFKINVSENKTDSIGGKYAIFQRNGDTYYKSFSLAGLISFQSDVYDMFCSKREAFGDNVELYEAYNKSKEITSYDFIYERFFRKKVMDFLYDGKPKLFKSPTEGNILVRLMNITFTPNKSLNRLIYTFSAEAIEYDDATMENYNKYNLVEVGE